MTFDELASELRKRYESQFSCRTEALESFGKSYRHELVDFERNGQNIETLVDAAGIENPEHWASIIRRGM